MAHLRIDLQLIADRITPGSRILDVGCGDGELLAHIAEHKQTDGHGIELSQEDASTCVQKGLSVIQGNADTDLIYYPSKGFDYVVSSRVIQATHNPKLVLQEMVRIGRTVIVSLPNFGYFRNRTYLLLKGRMPVTKTLSYEWYETPNIHFCTVDDFQVLCDALNCKIRERLHIGKDGKLLGKWPYGVWPNMFAEYAVFVLEA